MRLFIAVWLTFHAAIGFSQEILDQDACLGEGAYVNLITTLRATATVMLPTIINRYPEAKATDQVETAYAYAVLLEAKCKELKSFDSEFTRQILKRLD